MGLFRKSILTHPGKDIFIAAPPPPTHPPSIDVNHTILFDIYYGFILYVWGGGNTYICSKLLKWISYTIKAEKNVFRVDLMFILY